MRAGLERIRKRAPDGSNGRPSQARTPLRERLGARVGYRTRTLGLGLLLAVLAGLLTLAYVNRAEQRGALAAANVRVFVAARDVAAGTPGSTLLGRNVLVAQRVPRRSVVPGAISNRGQVEKLVAVEPIYAGEQVTSRRFRPLAENGVRGELNGTTRAIVVPGDATQLMAGIVKNGDHVDVLATLPSETARGERRSATRVILRDLLVLSAPGAENAAGEGAKGGNTIVLALTDAQAQKLFHALKSGQWSLLLRPFGRAADSRTAVDTSESVLGAGR
jgi:Flp pilus assembly protein CpaB